MKVKRNSVILVTRLVVPNNTAYYKNVLKVSRAFCRIGVLRSVIAPRNPEASDAQQSTLYLELASYLNLTKKTLWSFSLAVLIEAICSPKDAVFYTRDPDLAWFLTIFRKRVICHIHGNYARGFSKRKNFENWIKRVALRRGKFEKVFVSEGLANYFLRRGMQNYKIYVSRNGTSLLEFSKIKPMSLKKGSGRGELACAYTGSISLSRGFEIIVRLAASFPSVHFHLAGHAPRTLVRELHVYENVTYHGEVSAELSIAIQKSVDILLMPYSDEVMMGGGFSHSSSIIGPLKMFEYLAASKPILASDCAGIREVLDENNAILRNYTDLDAWTEALNCLMENPSMRQRLSRGAAHTAENYDIDRVMIELLNRS